VCVQICIQTCIYQASFDFVSNLIVLVKDWALGWAGCPKMQLSKYYIAFYPEYRNILVTKRSTPKGMLMNRRDALTVALMGGGVAVGSSQSPAQADTAPAGSTLERIKRTGALRIGVIVGQEPYFHKDLASGQWSGACIDMANDI